MDASLISQMKAINDENCRLKWMYADLSMQADLLKEALGKNDAAIHCPEGKCVHLPCVNAARSVARHNVSIAPACRAFGVSETCYRYGPKPKAENEEIADMRIGLTDARKSWRFGLCFLHSRNVKGHPWTHMA